MNSERVAVRDAFNLHASVYDERFARSAAGQAMRQAVWNAVDNVLPAGSCLMDLGCGTGEDAIHFAQRGSSVFAVDIAPEMISALNLKARSFGVSARVDARVSDLDALGNFPGKLDAIFSNFGAINCVGDLRPLGTLALNTLRPGGHVILVSMGRLYPLETAAFLAKGDIRGACRRLRRAHLANVEGRQFPVWYHSPRRLQRALGKEFSRIQLLGIRALLPVPGLEHLESRLPFRLLEGLDSVLTRSRFTAAFADHYLSIWQRRSA